MRVCAVCGTQFSESEITCPGCKNMMGGFLGKSLTGYEDMKETALQTVQSMEQSWAFNPFATGWRLVDILGRIAIALALISMAFWMHQLVERQYEGSTAMLDTHRSLASSRHESENRELRSLSYEYASLSENTGELLIAMHWNGQLFVAVLWGMIALLATSAVASYGQFKQLNRIKATLKFLCTEEGRAFVGEILVYLASEQHQGMQPTLAKERADSGEIPLSEAEGTPPAEPASADPAPVAEEAGSGEPPDAAKADEPSATDAPKDEGAS